MLTKYSSTIFGILAAIVISLIVISNQTTNVLAQSLSSSSSSLPTAGQVQNVPSPTVTNNSNVPHLKDASIKIEKVLSGLDSQTNIAFIKNNDLLILEKNGTILRAINGSLSDKPL